LLNPPSDPNLRNLADSAIRAVRRCNPMHIPAAYMPYYEQWKARVVRFDPEDML
jgi:colicin import membrane protein